MGDFYCPRCGHEDDDMFYCENCGTRTKPNHEIGTLDGDTLTDKI